MGPLCVSLEDLELASPRALVRLKRGKGAYTLKSPNSLAVAKDFLKSLAPSPHSEMVRLCVNCHRFITGAPHLSVDHSGGVPGTQCQLPHHPQPCPGTDRRGLDCKHVDDEEDDLGVRVLDEVGLGASGAQPLLIPVTTTQEGGASQVADVLFLQQQLENLQKERDEERRRAEILEMRNANLQDSHVRLSQQLVSQSQVFFYSNDNNCGNKDN